jgi:hypothetical protein
MESRTRETIRLSFGEDSPEMKTYDRLHDRIAALVTEQAAKYLEGFNDAKEQAAEEAWRTCKSRSRSLSESRMVTASNEASKCARVCKGNILKLQPEAKR